MRAKYSRRTALSTFGQAAFAAAVAPRRVLAQDALVPLRTTLAPVIADESRIIRTVVGLRPFRRTGFALYATTLGGKRLVHNYGHGGGGISLSWGCATLAADLLNDVATRRAAVMGCGILGLSTARILQERGFDVTIYAESIPPNTTSNIAGGQWAPTSVFASGAAAPGFMSVLQQAAAIANRRFQLMAGTRYGIRWIDNYDLTTSEGTGQYDTDSQEGIALFTDVARIDPATTPFSTPFVRRFATMLIEPNTYLPALLEDYYVAGGRIRIKRFANVPDVAHLEEEAIVNCTGLGSHELFGDDDLYPVRGQLTVLEPQPDVNYILVAPGPTYMFPRSDGIVVGGTFQAHDASTDVDPQTVHDKLASLRALYRQR
jgi:D-amino-acid oxidase